MSSFRKKIDRFGNWVVKDDLRYVVVVGCVHALTTLSAITFGLSIYVLLTHR